MNHELEAVLESRNDYGSFTSEENFLTELSNTSSVNIVYDFEQHPDWLSAVSANQVAYMPHMHGDIEPEELVRCLKALNSSKLLGDVNLRLTSITVVAHD